jgi:murein DD-endopeptidase MepM/ murein hydrolase activator NlpD
MSRDGLRVGVKSTRIRRSWVNRALGLMALAALSLSTTSMPRTHAQSEAPRPFTLPFGVPPGPDTWLLGQTYGNTTGAYRQRSTTYGASQGVHFGIDFSAPCGTELVALADGVVYAVDALSFGSAPHNLLIDHPNEGYTVLYGHLLDTPTLRPGQEVKRGEVIALSGDPADTCFGRPHLHLEVRDIKNRARKVNPVMLIEADWDNLSLVGPFSRTFERDLDDPRKWQHLDDQPDAYSGGALLNDFRNPWPPDLRGR